MKTVEVYVDSSNLQLTQSGSIVGPISVRLGDIWFPCRGWTDFPIYLLADWLEKLRGFRNSFEKLQLVFMDGPYHLSIDAHGKVKVRISGEHRGLTGSKELASIVSNKDCIHRAIREAGLAVLPAAIELDRNNTIVRELGRLVTAR